MNRLKKYLDAIAKEELDNYIWDIGEYGFPKMPYGYAAIQQYVIGRSYYDVVDAGVYPTIVINLRTGARANVTLTDEDMFLMLDGELVIVNSNQYITELKPDKVFTI